MAISPVKIIGAFLIVSLFIGVQGHSYVTSPQSRSNQKQTNTGCRGPACLGPCDVSLSARSANAAVHTASRGDSITVQWPRNNHAGGFIRFAWALTTQSDTHSAFDTHVQEISCHETGGCFPDDPANPNGGDSGPGDGSSRACSHTLTVPADLVDGQWTLQWAWFGGAFSLGDYYSCIDYRISGGVAGSTPVPKFIGGDYSFPNQQKCKFFNTDKLHVCVNEPCSNPIYSAAQQQSGAPAYVQANFPVTPTPAAGTSTTAAPVVRPATTTTGTPSTPSTSTSSTTAAAPVVRPSTTTTTGRSSTTTTGAPAASTSTSSSSGSCVSGYMKCLADGSYSTCNHEVWGPSQPCGMGTSCSPSGNYIYCVASNAPISTPTTPTVPTPTTPTVPTPTTPTTPTPVPSTPSTPVSGSCTLGYQQCVGSNSYKTCGNGRDGPVWAGEQFCQTGLSCHASATANNIYCY